MLNSKMRVAASFFILLATSSSGYSSQKEDLVKAATKEGKNTFHVIFRETIKSKEQSKWIDRYGASIELYKDGKLVKKFRGSTLPNHLPGKDKPGDWMYSVVQANCAFPPDLQKRYYTWTSGKRADGKRECLRLAEKVPTVAVGSERANDMTLKEVIDLFVAGSSNAKYQYATNILVHSGYKTTWRGSAGCLTIHPEDAASFFNAIPNGTKGTLEVARGIEDGNKSYCY